MTKTFLYTELQVSVPFDHFDWAPINESLKQVPGLVRKTWLSALNTHTIGGFYEFDSEANALAFAQGGFVDEAREAGAVWTTKLFDGEVVAAASMDMGSPHY